MNKDLDERILPNGQYRDARNIRVGTSDGTNVGSVQNVMGNTQASSLRTAAASLGISLPDYCTTIGSYVDVANNNIYWFITGNYNMVAKFHDNGDGTGVTSILLAETKGRLNEILKFNTSYLITGVNLVDNMLFWTDNLNPPRKINVTRTYKVNQFTEADISVIVAPPLNPPTVVLSNDGSDSNNIKDRFIRFAYRWKYIDNEYSALSPFSEVAFFPSTYAYDYGTGSNKSMVNANNVANVTFETGGSNVKEIQLIFKDSQSLNANIVENITRANGTPVTFEFKNNKAYAVLPADQVTRLFDNVPLKAKAQEYIGNRLAYGNYTQFYNIANCQDVPIKIDLKANLSQTISTAKDKNIPKKTWKSGRDYEVGIAYLDDYGRMTTVLTSDKNTVSIPLSKAKDKNDIKVSIKNEAPCFATKYRFFIKQSKTEYYNVFPTQYFQYGLYTYFLIQKADIDKVQKDSYITIKSTPTGATESNSVYKILEAENKVQDFLNNPPNKQPEGFYIKLKIDEGYFSGKSGTFEYEYEGFGYASNQKISNANKPFSNRISIVEKPIFYGSGNSTLSALNQFNGANDMRFSVIVEPGNKFSYRMFPNSGYIQSKVTMNSQFAGTKKGNWLKDAKGNSVAFIMFASGVTYTPGDSWRINCRSNKGNNTFGGPTDFTYGSETDGGFAAIPYYQNSSGSLIDLPIKPGALIKIDISESQELRINQSKYLYLLEAIKT